jgi:GDP-L-fucose synthase
MRTESKILVTGGEGMAGGAVTHRLRQVGYKNILSVDKDDCDLRNTEKVNAFFEKHRPEYVFHIAAKVGGIHANDNQSADFIYENLMMECNVIEAARKYEVKKLLFCGSACIYPKFAPQPIEEASLLSSSLEETNIGYAVAKIAGVIMCRMYRKQYGCNFISVMPTNLYGVGDNFHLMDSHVMPALIRKFYDAKMTNKSEVEVWGTGDPRREFLNVDDLADALVFLMLHYDGAEQINVGTGKDIPIKELVQIIKDVVGYEGMVVWNTTYPDGVYERRLDVSKINSLGWYAIVDLKEGIKATYDWFMSNYDFIRK